MALSQKKFPDHRIHVATINSLQLKPPYAEDLMVTSASRFVENKWIYPKSQLPAANKKRGVINFLRAVKLSNGKFYALDEKRDAILLNQLKEALYGLTFHRNVLPNRKHIAKPLHTIITADRLLILFANFAAAGVKSLNKLTPRVMRRISKTSGTARKHTTN